MHWTEMEENVEVVGSVVVEFAGMDWTARIEQEGFAEFVVLERHGRELVFDRSRDSQLDHQRIGLYDRKTGKRIGCVKPNEQDWLEELFSAEPGDDENSDGIEALY
jgi:hypothetical protein